ncbi:alpha/beta fold hydrolase [Streptomyces sp. NL15-2K]|uniref:alpha/beta fold hydrolase n=1 Tax=Streptomyces sp. NL15-2K TaxID=376149 RepID=UPI00155A25F7|nr:MULTISPECIES: alpha/beta hydrolase [Actinomycetes]WKX13299.1 alpha/beta hydrolase [Kutzneria buriramensis]
MTASDGVELHYREKGRGRPIVFIPGFTCTTRFFDRQLDALSDRFRVIVYDPRGQGESEKTRRGQRVGRLAHDAHDILTALGLYDVVPVGWSLGATTLLSYLDLFGSDRIRKICLIGSSPSPVNRAGWTNGIGDVAAGDALRTALEQDFATVAPAAMRQWFHRLPPEGEFHMLAKETLKTAPAEGAAAALWDGLNQNMFDLLPHIALPTLIIHGEHDALVPVVNADVFREKVPDVRVEIFADSGHAPFIEEPGRFNELLNDFAG